MEHDLNEPRLPSPNHLINKILIKNKKLVFEPCDRLLDKSPKPESIAANNELTRKNSKNSFVSAASTNEDEDDEFDDDEDFPTFEIDGSEGG